MNEIKNTKKVGKLSMKTMLLLFGLVPLVTSMLIYTIVVSVQTAGNLRQMTFDKLLVVNKELNVESADVINGTEEFDYEMLDTFSEDGVVATIFKDKTRLYSSVKDESGKRAEGTDATDAVIQEVLVGGNSFEANDVEIAGEKYYVTYLPVKDESGQIIGMSFTGESRANVSKLTMSTIMPLVLMAAAFFVVFVIIIILISRVVERPLHILAEELDLIAGGTLGHPFEIHSNIHETKSIVLSLKKLQEKLSEVVSVVQKSAGDAAHTSSGVADTANQISQTTDSVSIAVDGIANGAEDQAHDVQNSTENVGNISDAITKVMTSTQQIDSIIEDMNSNAATSNEKLEELNSSSQSMADSIESISEKINRTSDAVLRITDKVNAINDIAAQTNLLSLNASIEAARAGEAGRGFAVVADEIRVLSDNSAQAASEINAEIQALRKESEAAVQQSVQVHDEAKKQKDIIQNTIDNVQSLISGIRESVTGMADLVEQIQVCDESKIVIVDAMSNLSALSEENAASAEETSAALAELNSSVSDLAGVAKELQSVAVNLQEEMSFFK